MNDGMNAGIPPKFSTQTFDRPCGSWLGTETEEICVPYDPSGKFWSEKIQKKYFLLLSFLSIQLFFNFRNRNSTQIFHSHFWPSMW